MSDLDPGCAEDGIEVVLPKANDEGAFPDNDWPWDGCFEAIGALEDCALPKPVKDPDSDESEVLAGLLEGNGLNPVSL